MIGAVLHNSLPFAPWLEPAARRLPGIQPLHPDDWIIRDETFASQMRLRDALLAHRPKDVHALRPEANAAAQECLDLVLEALRDDPEYTATQNVITRPDGVAVPLDRTQPMVTLGRLVQSDLCLMHPGPNGHVLTGAALCFPAGWTLSQKIGRPMSRIHLPVPLYDEKMGERVQRLFDSIRPGQVLGRANAFLYDKADLFAPRVETDPRPHVDVTTAKFVRSERQTLRRLPASDAIVFGIHTYVVAIDRLTPQQRNSLDRLT